MRRRILAALILQVAFIGPAILSAMRPAAACAMCSEHCCCKPPDGSAMSGSCRLSRPCAAGERKDAVPLVAADPAILAVVTPIAAPPEASGFPRGASPTTFDRTASPPVPPPWS